MAEENDLRVARELVDEGDKLGELGLWSGALARYQDCLRRFDGGDPSFAADLERARAGCARASLELAEPQDPEPAGTVEPAALEPAALEPEPEPMAPEPEPEPTPPKREELLAQITADSRRDLQIDLADQQRRTAASLAERGSPKRALALIDTALDDLGESVEPGVAEERAALLEQRAGVLRRLGRVAEARQAEAQRDRLLGG